MRQGPWDSKRISLISKKPGSERKRNTNQVSQTERRCDMTVKTKTFRSNAAWSRFTAQGGLDQAHSPGRRLIKLDGVKPKHKALKEMLLESKGIKTG